MNAGVDVLFRIFLQTDSLLCERPNRKRRA